METISRLALTFLVNALWQVALVACVGAVCHHLMRRAPAGYRHVVWVVVLALSVLLPLGSVWTSWNTSQFPTLVAATARRAPLRSLSAQAGAAGLPLQSGPTAQKLKSAGNPFARGVDFLQRRTGPIRLSPLLAWIVLACYAISLLIHISRLWRAWSKTKAIKRTAYARALPAAMTLSARHCGDSLGLAPVPILASAEVAGPMTLGARRMVIILPDNLFLEASAAEVTSVFAHEMAHILRRDFLMNVIYELVSLPVSFHPAMTLIKRRINETRELACDEIAAGRLTSAPDYARSLVALARRMSTAPAPSRSGYSLGVFDANILEERVMKILDQKSRVSSRLAKASLAAGVFLLTASCILASAFNFSVSQEDKAQPDETLRPFVGTWKARLKGKPYVTLALSIANHTLVGKVSSYRVVLDENGRPADVRQEPDECPVTDAKVDGRKLTLSSSCAHGNTLKFAIELKGEREMEVHTLGAPPPPEESGGLILTREPDGAGQISGGATQFAGTWQAMFEGKAFTTLKLETNGDKLTGTMSPYRITIDRNGKLTGAEKEENGGGWRILEATADGPKLLIKAKEEGSEDVDQFEMQLTGGSEAEFKPLGSPMPVEPWKMVREIGQPTGGIVAPALSGVVAPLPRLASISDDVQPVLAGKNLKGLDFSGRWELDKSKSDLPNPSPNNLVQQIEQRGSQLKISTSSKDWDMNKPIAATLFALTIPEFTTDSDALSRTQKFGPGELHTKSYWEDGKLVTDWKLLRDGKEVMAGKWFRSLSDDGKTLKLRVTAGDSQSGKGEAMLVFVKKP